MSEMSSDKPYLIRAIYEWINDNQCTAYLVVFTQCAGLSAPSHLLQEERLTLNISPTAVRGLVIDNACIQFTASFAGEVTEICIPIESIIAIIAKENQQGMMFDIDEAALQAAWEKKKHEKSDPQSTRPSLKVIK